MTRLLAVRPNFPSLAVYAAAIGIIAGISGCDGSSVTAPSPAPAASSQAPGTSPTTKAATESTTQSATDTIHAAPSSANAPAARPAEAATTPPKTPPSHAPPRPARRALAPDKGPHKGLHRWSAALGSPEADVARDVAVDHQGHLLVTGYHGSPLELAGAAPRETQKFDAFIAKYAPGGELLWTTSLGGIGEDAGNAITIDHAGNIIVVGLFAETMAVGTSELMSAGSDDVFIAKFAPDGTPQWAQSLGGPDSDAAYDVSVDLEGRIYVTGAFRQTIYIAGTAVESAGNEDIYLLTLAPTGELVRIARFGERYRDFGQRIAADDAGNVVLLAEFTDEVSFGGESLVSEGNRDLLLAKYNREGQHLWSKRFGSPFNELGLGLALDPAGNIAITGSYDQSITFGGENLKSRGESDIFIARFDRDGKHLWSRSFGSKREDIGYGIATDTAGNIAVTGWFRQDIDFGGIQLEALDNNKDIFLLKFSAGGDIRWARRFGSSGNDQGRGVAMAESGDIAVVGLFRFDIELGGDALASKRDPDLKVPPPDAFVGVFGR